MGGLCPCPCPFPYKKGGVFCFVLNFYLAPLESFRRCLSKPRKHMQNFVRMLRDFMSFSKTQKRLRMTTFREPPREVESCFLPSNLPSVYSLPWRNTDSLMGINTCSFPFSAQNPLTRIAKVSHSLPGLLHTQDPRLSPPSLSSLRFLLL